VALVLFLFGLFALMAFYANQIIQYYKENINIMVEIKEEATPEETQNLQRFLTQQSFIIEKSIKLTTKEEASEEMKSEIGDFTQFGFQNPFRDVLHFNVSAEFVKPAVLNSIKEKLMTHKAVYNVYFQEAIVLALEKNVRKVGIVMIGLGTLFLLVAITLIHNTIRLALYANRFIIKNMQLVGASWQFISKPFLWKSLQNGLWSSLLALAGLVAILLLINLDIPLPESTNSNLIIAVILGGLTLLGLLINFFSTYYVVNKYLKMRVDDLY
jgi:cell division transport system permease protein